MEIEYKNKNIKNMFKELKHEFPEDFGSCDGLTVDAIDFTDSYDNYDTFDETILSEVVISYRYQTITISRYYDDGWEIHDETYIDFENFRAIGKILNIVMKHLSKIEFK